MRRLIQSTLTGDKNPEYPIFVFSKQVKSKEIKSSKIIVESQKKKLFDVINSLKNLGKTRKIEEINLKEDCRILIDSIISNFPKINERDMKLLLFDFTDSMQTTMRKEEKYVVSLVSEKGLIMCHSVFGEETITPKWDVVQRMLDKDNVIRFVDFSKESGEIEVTYYELYPSESFINWLGLPEKESFSYLGGKNRIITEVEGISCALELNDDEIFDKLIKGELKVEDGLIHFHNPIHQLPILQIRSGKKRYGNLEDFLQDFLAKQYDLSYYQEEYKRLRSSLDPLFYKYIDERDKVICHKGGETKIMLRKINPNFILIFADGNIEIRRTFLSEILTKIINNQNFRLFHAGMPLSPKPIKIGSMEIFNKLNSHDTINILTSWLTQTQLNDHFVLRLTLSAMFKLIAIENKGKPIEYLFKKLSGEIRIKPPGKVVELESKVLEFKSRDKLAGTDKEITERLKEDIKKKLSQSNIKFYIVGIDELSREIEPIPTNRWPDSRILNVEDSLRDKLNVSKLRVLKVPLNGGNNCLVIVIVVK